MAASSEVMKICQPFTTVSSHRLTETSGWIMRVRILTMIAVTARSVPPIWPDFEDLEALSRNTFLQYLGECITYTSTSVPLSTFLSLFPRKKALRVLNPNGILYRREIFTHKDELLTRRLSVKMVALSMNLLGGCLCLYCATHFK